MAGPRTRDDFVRFYRERNPNDPSSDSDIISYYADQARERGVLEQFPDLETADRERRMAAAPGLGGEFTNAFGRGVDQVQAKLYDTAALAGSVTGIEGLQNWGDTGRDRNQQEAATYSPATISKVGEISSPTEFAYWLTGLVGEQAPQLIGTTAVAALAAAAAPETAIAGAGAGAFSLGTRLLSSVGINTARQLAAATAAGAFGFTQMQNYGELKAAGGEDAEALAIANGLIGGALESIVPASAAFRVFKSAGLDEGAAKVVAGNILDQLPAPILKVATRAATEGSKEMLTEIAQEALTIGSEMISQRNNPDFAITDEEIRSRLVNSGVAGFVLGGGLGAVTGGDRGNSPASAAPVPLTPGEQLHQRLSQLPQASLDPVIPPAVPAPAAPAAPVAAAAAPVAPPAGPVLANPLLQQQLVALGMTPAEAAVIPQAEAEQIIASRPAPAPTASSPEQAHARFLEFINSPQARMQQAVDQARLESEATARVDVPAQRAELSAQQQAAAYDARRKAALARQEDQLSNSAERYLARAARVMKSSAPKLGKTIAQAEAGTVTSAPNVLVQREVAPVQAPTESTLTPGSVPKLAPVPVAETPTPAAPMEAEPSAPVTVQSPASQAGAPLEILSVVEPETTLAKAAAKSPYGDANPMTDAQFKTNVRDLVWGVTTAKSKKRGEIDRTTRNAAVIKDSKGRLAFVPVYDDRDKNVRLLLREKLTKVQRIQKVTDAVNAALDKDAKKLSFRTVEAILADERPVSKESSAKRNEWVRELAAEITPESGPTDVSVEEFMQSKPDVELLGYLQFKNPLPPGPREYAGSLENLALLVEDSRQNPDFREGSSLKGAAVNEIYSYDERRGAGGSSDIDVDADTEIETSREVSTADVLSGTSNVAAPKAQELLDRARELKALRSAESQPALTPSRNDLPSRVTSSSNQLVPAEARITLSDEAIEELAGTLSKKKIINLLAQDDAVVGRGFAEELVDYLDGDQLKEFRSMSPEQRGRAAKVALRESVLDLVFGDVRNRQAPPEAYLRSSEDVAGDLGTLIRTAAAMGFDIGITKADGKSAAKLLQVEGGAASIDPDNKMVILVTNSVLNPNPTTVLSALHEIMHGVVASQPEWLQKAMHDMVERIPLGKRAYFQKDYADWRVRDGSNPANLEAKELSDEKLVEHLTLKGVEQSVAQNLVATFWRAVKDLFFRAALYLQKQFIGEENTGGRLATEFADNLVAQVRGGDALRVKNFLESFGVKPTYGRIARLVHGGDVVVIHRIDPRTGEVIYPKSPELTPAAARYNVENPIAAAKETIFSSGLLAKADAEEALATAVGDDTIFTAKNGKPFSEAKSGDNFSDVNWSTIPRDDLGVDDRLIFRSQNPKGGLTMLEGRLSNLNKDFIQTPAGKVQLLASETDPIYGFFSGNSVEAGRRNRVYHWVTGAAGDRRVLRPDRAPWVMRVPDTLENPHVVYRNVAGSWVFIRRYNNGTVHAVVVNQDRFKQLYVETQFPLTETDRSGEIVHLRKWPESAGSEAPRPAAQSATNGALPSQTSLSVQNGNPPGRQVRQTQRASAQEEIKLLTEQAVARSVSNARVDTAKANQFIRVYNQLFERAKQQYPELTYEEFMRAHGSTLDPRSARQETAATLLEQLKLEADGDGKTLPFDQEVLIDQLENNERGLADYELAKEVNRHAAKIAARHEDGVARADQLEKRAEKDRQIVAEIDKSLADMKTTDQTARAYIRDYLKDLTRDLKRLDTASNAVGEADGVISQLESGIERKELAERYTDNLIDTIDTKEIGITSMMKGLFDLEKSAGLDLATARPLDVRAAIVNEIALRPNSPLNELISYGSGPSARVRGTALLTALLTFIKQRGHVTEVMRTQLANTKESREALVELHSILSETSETKLEEAKQVASKDLKKPGNRLIYSFLKRRDRAVAELKELARLKRDNELLGVSAKVIQDLKARAESRMAVSSDFILTEGSTLFDPKNAEESSESLAARPYTLTMGREKFLKSAEVRGILGRQADWLAYRADKPELQDVVYHSVAALHQKLRLAVGSDKVNATLAGWASGYHDNIGEMLKRTGTRTGSLAQRMWVKFSEIQRSLSVSDSVAGKRWENTRERFMKLAGLSADAAHETFYRPALMYLQSNPQLTEDEAYAQLERRFRANSSTAPLMQRAGAWTALKDWLLETKANNLRRTQTSVGLGNKVRDEALTQTNVFSKKDAAALRAPLERGVTGYTVSQKLHRDISAVITTMSKRLQAVGDGPSNPFNQAAERLAADKEGLRTALQEFMTPEVQAHFLDPLILNAHNSTLSTPTRPDGLSLRVPLDVAAQAWRNAEGDLLKFAEQVHGAFKEGTSESVDEYTARILGWVSNTFQKLNREVNPAPESVVMMPSGVSHVAMDARVADNFPPEWVDFHHFAVEDNRASSHLIAANAAFGRNFSDLYASYEATRQELDGLAKELGGTPEIRNARKKQHAGEKGWYELRANAEEMLKKLEELPEITRKIFDPTRGGFDDLTLATELHATVVTGMLVGLKSAVKNLLSPTDTLAVENSLSVRSLQTVGRGYVSAGKYFLNALARMFGVDLLKDNRYARLIEQAGGFDRANFMTLSDLASGTRGRGNTLDHTARGKLQRIVRMTRNVVTDARLGASAGGTGPALRAFNQFQFTQLLSNYSITEALLKRFEELSLRAADFYTANPDKAGTELTAADLGWADAKGFDSLKAEGLLHGIVLEDLGQQVAKRKKANAEILDTDTVRKVMNLALDRVAGESSPTNRPAYLLTSRFARANASLIGWSFFKSAQVMRMLRDKQGQRDIFTLLQGAKVMAFGLVPAAIAFSLLLDEYDEEITGKKSNLRPLSMDDLFDTVLERSVAMGSFGILGDFIDTAHNVKDGAGQRLLSVDQRIVWVNSVIGLTKAVADLQAMGGFENANYANFWRRVGVAFGAGGVLQYVQAANKFFDPDVALFRDEAGVTARTNVGNLLRSYGRDNGMEVRLSGGAATPTPMTPWVTNMALASYLGDQDGFREAYRGALEAAQSMGKASPMQSVAESFASRHPLRGAFRNTPTAQEVQALLAQMPDEGRRAVQQAMNSFNQFGNQLGIAPFMGVQGASASVISNAARRNPANVADLRAMLAARRNGDEL